MVFYYYDRSCLTMLNHVRTKCKLLLRSLQAWEVRRFGGLNRVKSFRIKLAGKTIGKQICCIDSTS